MKTGLEFASIGLLIAILHFGGACWWATMLVVLMYMLFGVYAFLDGFNSADTKNFNVLAKFTEDLDRE